VVKMSQKTEIKSPLKCVINEQCSFQINYSETKRRTKHMLACVLDGWSYNGIRLDHNLTDDLGLSPQGKRDLAPLIEAVFKCEGAIVESLDELSEAVDVGMLVNIIFRFIPEEAKVE